MKQRTTVFVIAAVLLLVASPVFAQNVRQNVRNGATSTANRIELQTNIAKKRATNTFRVFTATIERLENIAKRIESRIAKVEAAGGTAAESRAALAEARNHLSLAKTSIAAFASVDLSGSDVRAKYNRVKAVAAEAKIHIRETHRALMRAVVSLKPGFRTSNATSTRATSTATSTSQ